MVDRFNVVDLLHWTWLRSVKSLGRVLELKAHSSAVLWLYLQSRVYFLMNRSFSITLSGACEWDSWRVLGVKIWMIIFLRLFSLCPHSFQYLVFILWYPMANIEQYKDRIFNMICPTVPPGDLETFDNAFLIFCISWLDETMDRNSSECQI